MENLEKEYLAYYTTAYYQIGKLQTTDFYWQRWLPAPMVYVLRHQRPDLLITIPP